ncbi:hypothetical protein PMAYCL1PPCAC_19345, partial [Pristionchus mayeri]
SSKRNKVELSSVHVDKEKPLRPMVERGPIKTDNAPAVEREPLYKIIPQYDNLPEDPLMKQMRAPRDPSNSNREHHAERRSRLITELLRSRVSRRDRPASVHCSLRTGFRRALPATSPICDG